MSCFCWHAQIGSDGFPNMKVTRSAHGPAVNGTTANIIAPLLVGYFHWSSSKTYSSYTNPPWHEVTSSNRNCRCTQRGPRCEVTRWPRLRCIVLGGQVVKRPGEERAVIHSREHSKTCCSFVCVGFHCPAWLRLSRTEPGRGLHMHRGVHAAPLRASQPRARETTCGRKINRG